MKYFYDSSRAGIAHLWDGENSFCGFLNSNPAAGREVHGNKRHRPVCHACEVRWHQWNLKEDKA